MKRLPRRHVLEWAHHSQYLCWESWSWSEHGPVFFQSVQALTALVGGRAVVRGSRTRASYIGFLLCLMSITGQLGSRGTWGGAEAPKELHFSWVWWKSLPRFRTWPGAEGLCLPFWVDFTFSSVHVHSQSCLIFVTPWTVACQASLSMGFSRQEYQSGLPCMPPGGSSHQGSTPHRLCLLHRQEGPLPLAPPGKPFTSVCTLIKGCYSATPLN